MEHSEAVKYFGIFFGIFSGKNLKFGPLFGNNAGSRNVLLISLCFQFSDIFLQFAKKFWAVVFEQTIWM